MRSAPYRALLVVMADHRPAGRVGAGPVAAWRITGLQRSVRLRAGEDVVLASGTGVPFSVSEFSPPRLLASE